MRGTLTLAAGLGVAVLLTLPAGAVSTTDIYITGQVMSRVAGKNASLVRIAWDYKCLGEDGGTYEWTLKLVRTQPEPAKTTSLGSGTGERGSKTVQLSPGRYLPTANPFFCETRFGQSFDKPEIGGPFVVPDYCSWVVSSARGLVQLEQRASVKRAKAGSVVAPGDALVTPRNGKAGLTSSARDGTAVLGSASRLVLDAKRCGKAGWKLKLAGGSLTVSVPKSAKGSFSTATQNAAVSARPGARWKIEYAKGKTKVRVTAGVVRLGGKTLKRGQTATI
jgi:hypothetical protein